MNMWLISDTHFGHYNIIKYCSRPFTSVTEMDEAMVANWNSVVKPEDHIYHLGDVDIRRGGKVQQDHFLTLMKRLNGHKRLILGNHDHFPIKVYSQVFEKVVGTGQWLGDGLILSHYPIHPASLGRAKACVHGHVHNNQNDSFPPVIQGDRLIPYVNVSVEVISYTPIHIDTIHKRLNDAKSK